VEKGRGGGKVEGRWTRVGREKYVQKCRWRRVDGEGQVEKGR
jgi:hypothetical protein